MRALRPGRGWRALAGRVRLIERLSAWSWVPLAVAALVAWPVMRAAGELHEAVAAKRDLVAEFRQLETRAGRVESLDGALRAAAERSLIGALSDLQQRWRRSPPIAGTVPRLCRTGSGLVPILAESDAGRDAATAHGVAGR